MHADEVIDSRKRDKIKKDLKDDLQGGTRKTHNGWG